MDEIEPPRRPRWRKLGFVLLLVAAIAYLTTSGYLLLRPDDSPITTARRLISSERILGMDEGELVALFGPSASPTYFRDWHARWVLGPSQGYFAIDSTWLVVRYDKRGRVVEAAIVED